MAATSRSAVIVGGNRIPFARSNGPYAHASNQDMLTATLDGLVARFALQEERLGEVVAGRRPQHAGGLHLTRGGGVRSPPAPRPPPHQRPHGSDNRPPAAPPAGDQ